MRISIVLALVMAVAGCKKADNDGPVLINAVQLHNAVTQRTAAAFERPEVAQALDAAFASLGSDPAVTAQLGTFVGKLQADPRAAGAVKDLMDHLMDDPQVLANLNQVMAENPGATPQQIGELFGSQFQHRWESPEVSQAWMAAWNELTRKIGARPELAAMFTSAVNKATSGLASPEAEAKISRKLIEKNGGQRPDVDKATQLALDHMWTTERIDQLLVMLLTNPTVRTATAKFLADVMADDEISKAVVAQVGALAANKETNAKALRVLQVVYAKDVVIADVRTSLHALMTDDALVRAIGDLLAMLQKSPRFGALATKWYDTMAADPKLRSDAAAFLDNW
jgi:hypothetical protein